MIYCFYGNQADHAHEERMLQNFLSQLQLDWDGPEKWIYIVYNAMWNGQDVDFVCFSPFSIIVGDFKSYTGALTAGENGPWKLLNHNNELIEVKGGNQFNPYRQLRNNKFSLLNFLSNEPAFSRCELGHIGAVTVFTALTDVEDQLSEKTRKWMGITDIAHCSAYFAAKKSAGIRLEQQWVSELMGKMNLMPYEWQPKPPVDAVAHAYLTPKAVPDTAAPLQVKKRPAQIKPPRSSRQPALSKFWPIVFLASLLLIPAAWQKIGNIFTQMMSKKTKSAVSETLHQSTADTRGRAETDASSDQPQAKLKWSDEKPAKRTQQQDDFWENRPRSLERPEAERPAPAVQLIEPAVQKPKQQPAAEQILQPKRGEQNPPPVIAETRANPAPRAAEARTPSAAAEEKIQQADDLDSRLRDSSY